MHGVASFGTHTIRIIDDPVPVRFLLPSGRQCSKLSRALSVVWLNPQEFPSRVNIHRFVDFLDMAEKTMVGAAVRFIASVADCRKVVDHYVAKLGVHSRKARELGSRWLLPNAAIYRSLEDTLTAICAVTKVLAPHLFDGQDPSQVNKEYSRTGGVAVTTVNRRGQLRTDSDLRLRLGKDPTCAPRHSDPRVHERWLEGLKLIGSSDAIQQAHIIARGAGARAFMVLDLSLADLLLTPDGLISCPQKGTGGAHDGVLIPGDAEYQGLFAYVDGERRRKSGISLATLRLMAADPRQRHALSAMPLFTENGTSGIKYDRLYRVSRKAAERVNLFIGDGQYAITGIKRFVTFHYLRHEYVHTRLDFIETLPEKDQVTAKKALIAYMGWASDSMLQWYSAHHTRKSSNAAARAYNAHVERMMRNVTSKPALDSVDDRAKRLKSLATV